MTEKTKNIQDLRIKKTKRAILAAFNELLKEKPLDKISVTELAQRAEINKAPSTFTIQTSMHSIRKLCRNTWRRWWRRFLSLNICCAIRVDSQKCSSTNPRNAICGSVPIHIFQSPTVIGTGMQSAIFRMPSVIRLCSRQVWNRLKRIGSS